MEKALRIARIFFVLTLGILFFSCDNGNNPDGNNPNGNIKLIGLDISNATSLLIVPSSSLNGRAVQGENNKMFKITAEGYIQEISYSYEDEDGNQLTSTEIFVPASIYNMNEDYIMLCFSKEAYLLRKTDGAVFKANDIPIDMPQEANFKNAQVFQVDGSGNIYYQSGDYSSGSSQVVKINVTHPNNITRMDYLPNPDTANRFFVSPEGHIIYQTGGSQRRIRKANGGLYSMPVTQEGFFIGLDGKIKNLTAQTITIVDIDSEYNVATNTILVDGTPFNGTYGSESFSLYSISANQTYILRFPDKILIAGTGGGRIYEIEGDNPREIILFQIIIEKVYQSASFYYVVGENWSGQPVLQKISPYTDEVTDLVPVNTFSIYKMVVSDDDELTFNALRMSDGSKVLGNISASGNVTIIARVQDRSAIN
jgi:hypothetical protein